ncbi:MAG TPA: DUF6297 family protein [Micromonosporaceae bacterium]|nr:DUF6297 family protein [Micromonosporaceae bacterium]
MTATDTAVDIPTARQLRIRLRRGRRAHSGRNLGEALTDLYIVVLCLVMYGTAAIATLADQVHAPGAGQHSVQARTWLLAAIAVAITGAAWRGLRAIGPLLATPANLTWCAATPVDRRGWLLPRFAGLLVAAATVGAAIGGSAAVVASPGGLTGDDAFARVAAAALLGAACATMLCALAVVGQATPSAARWPTGAGHVLLGTGLAGAVVVIVVDRVGTALPQGSVGPPAVAASLWVLAVLAAIVATIAAARCLPRLNRSALSTGAGLASAAASAVIWLDLSLFAAVLAGRRWRRIGWVPSRPLRPGRRTWVLLQAEVRRVRRHRPELAAYALLLLVPYAAAVFSPTTAEIVRIVAGYLAANRLAAGLRTVSGSPALRRALGGSDRSLHLVHLIVPAAGLALWWPLAAAAVPLGHPLSALLVPAGVLAAVYRTATRPQLVYGGAMVDTPFGLIPVDLLRQMFRGPDVLALVVLLALVT